MSIQLPVCPRCGGKAKLDRGLPNMGNSNKRWAFTHCLVCGYRTKKLNPYSGESDKLLRERAIKEWLDICAGYQGPKYDSANVPPYTKSTT